MTGFDILVIITVIGVAAYYMYKKKKKKEIATATKELSSYAAFRNGLKQPGNLHGVSIISFYYDSAASYRDMHPDGTNTDFDLSCESRLNTAIEALRADGYSPVINAFSCVDRVMFYIIY